MTGKFTCRCPPMEVFKTDDPRVRMTDELYSDVTVEYGGARMKGYLRWKATPVRSHNHFITSVVDETSAEGYWFDDKGNKHIMYLQVNAEQAIGPLALRTKASGIVETPGGMLAVSAELPRVVSLPIGDGVFLVRDATVTGTVEGQA